MIVLKSRTFRKGSTAGFYADKYYGISYQTLEEAKQQMKFFSDLEKNGTGIWWAVCSLDNKTCYGTGGLNNLSNTHCEIKNGSFISLDIYAKLTDRKTC